MLMLMDAGNSRVKWVCHEDLSGVDAEDVDGIVNAEPYSLDSSNKQQTIRHLLDQEKPKKLILVHVLGGDFEQAVLAYCKKYEIECEIITTSTACCGVTNAYDIPENLGADRFVALIAAHHLSPKENVIVIDAGTAVTIDMINANGLHLGGVILPGLQLWSDTLIKNTQLQHISTADVPDVFAKSTKQGIDSGSMIGLSGAIHHVCDVMQQKLGQSVPVTRLFCGGDSRVLANYYQAINQSQTDIKLIPDLVIAGLQIIGQAHGEQK